MVWFHYIYNKQFHRAAFKMKVYTLELWLVDVQYDLSFLPIQLTQQTQLIMWLDSFALRKNKPPRSHVIASGFSFTMRFIKLYEAIINYCWCKRPSGNKAAVQYVPAASEKRGEVKRVYGKWLPCYFHTGVRCSQLEYTWAKTRNQS